MGEIKKRIRKDLEQHYDKILKIKKIKTWNNRNQRWEEYGNRDKVEILRTFAKYY